MSRRSIMLVDLGVPFGGVEIYVRAVAALLRRDVNLVVCCVNSQLAQSLRSEGIRIVSLTFARRWTRPVQVAIAALLLIGLRVTHQIDTVWINGYAEIALLPLARIAGCRTIATRHLTFSIEPGSWSHTWKRRAARFLYRHLACAAQTVICVSRTVAKDLASVVAETRLTVLPHWVSEMPAPEEREKLHSGLRLLFVGRLESYKGASLLLTAMRELLKDGDMPPVSLTIVGDGRCREPLEREAAGLDVRFTGFQSAVGASYREADLFIHPTLGPEGSSLVSMEAMSWGLPCILSDLEVNREIAGDGRYAVLFRRGDAADLCARIRMFLARPALLADYGRRARAAAVNQYGCERAREGYLRALGIGVKGQPS